ncbi:MAG: hypothetical protein KAR12_01435 [Methylococcales bacterium]|nr:hypothetical protein [Methylococcales bacterium]
MGRPIGSTKLFPTQEYQRELIQKLKEKAEEDDTLAIGLLLILCELNKHSY